jgi:hypothetical protein
MFNPFSAPLNIISFGIEAYRGWKQHKREIKNARTQAELERILNNNTNGSVDNNNPKQLHDIKGKNNR